MQAKSNIVIYEKNNKKEKKIVILSDNVINLKKIQSP